MIRVPLFGSRNACKDLIWSGLQELDQEAENWQSDRSFNWPVYARAICCWIEAPEGFWLPISR